MKTRIRTASLGVAAYTLFTVSRGIPPAVWRRPRGWLSCTRFVCPRGGSLPPASQEPPPLGCIADGADRSGGDRRHSADRPRADGGLAAWRNWCGERYGSPTLFSQRFRSLRTLTVRWVPTDWKSVSMPRFLSSVISSADIL